jgi:hypothetical protein
MINYVTSVEISSILRRRIKEEVIRQSKVFNIQCSNAGIAEYFKRHALVVRHTIDVLVTLAKVNVTPAAQLERSYPVVNTQKEPNQDVMSLIGEFAPKFGFSCYDLSLLKKLWNDFYQLSKKLIIRKPAIWAGAVLYAYSQINYTENFTGEDLAKLLGVSLSSIYSKKNNLFETLELKPFDPRYLSEEGFVLSLFMP